MTDSLPTPDKQVVTQNAFATMYRASITRSLQQGVDGLLDDMHYGTQEWGFSLSQIQQTVHLWYGGSDLNTPPAMTEYLAQQLSNSQLHNHPDDRHYLMF